MAHGVELWDDPETQAERCRYTPMADVNVEGATRHVIAWLEEIGQQAAALAVADEHHARKFHEAELSPLYHQWAGGDR